MCFVEGGLSEKGLDEEELLSLQVAVHPRSDLILSSSSDRQLRVWDLRAGKLCCTVLGHERPVHSCGFDEAGDHFLSCDSEMVLYWPLFCKSTLL